MSNEEIINCPHCDSQTLANSERCSSCLKPLDISHKKLSNRELNSKILKNNL